MKFWILPILSLGVSFLVFTIAIPIVQSKIDTKSARYEDFRFHAQQAMSKYAIMLDKYDTGHYLDVVLQDKALNEKHTKLISGIKGNLEKRCQELLADTIVLLTTNPEEVSQQDFGKKQSELRNTPLDKLFDIHKALMAKPLPASELQKDMIFWGKIRMWLYAIGGFFFVGGTILQIVSKLVLPPLP